MEGTVSWPEVDICLDLLCECEAELHYDGNGAFAVQCPVCLRIWVMESSQVIYRELRDDDPDWVKESVTPASAENYEGVD